MGTRSPERGLTCPRQQSIAGLRWDWNPVLPLSSSGTNAIVLGGTVDRLGSPGDKGPENGSETADRGLLPLLAQWGCFGGRRWRWMWG